MALKSGGNADDQTCAYAIVEDPFESAFEEAFEKILHHVCDLFPTRRTTHDFTRNTYHHPCIISRKQREFRRPFATTTCAFALTSNCRHDGDVKEQTQTEDSERFNRGSSARAVFVREIARREPKVEEQQMCEHSHAMTDLQINHDEKHVNKLAKIVTERIRRCSMASLTLAPSNKYNHEEDIAQESSHPSAQQLFSHPLALLSYVPKDVSLFFAGAVAGATAKTVTAPLDRIKLLMQVYRVKAPEEIAKRSIGFLEAAFRISKEEGMRGFWKGNLPQVIRVIPYSAVQLLSYELYKKLFEGNNNELSLAGRLAAGACAGMTSTLVTYPLDVLRLRLAVDPASKTMIQVASGMLREEGLSSFYRGLGPSLFGIAPYIALNFCAYDLIKKSLPEDFKNTPAASFLTAFLSASLATTMCYPLDTVRRQMQMKGTPYFTIFDAIPGIVSSDGVLGLYRGFVPNALKNLPNSSIRLTTFDAAKNLINASQKESQRLLNQRRGVASIAVDLPSVQRS